MATMRLLIGCLLVGGAAILTQAQTSNAGIAGSGVLSPSVVATYQGSGNMPVGPLTVDLLVLWRGSPGWFDERTDTGGGAGSHGVHVVRAGANTLQIRFDATTRTVMVQDRVVPLQQNNVLLLDEVGIPGGIKVAGLLRVDGRLSPTAQGGPNIDPMDAMVQRSSELFDYLRCDSRFTNANDPLAEGQLRRCEQLRGSRPLFYAELPSREACPVRPEVHDVAVCIGAKRYSLGVSRQSAGSVSSALTVWRSTDFPTDPLRGRRLASDGSACVSGQ